MGVPFTIEISDRNGPIDTVKTEAESHADALYGEAAQAVKDVLGGDEGTVTLNITAHS